MPIHSNREPVRDQRKHCTKIDIGEPMSLVGLVTGVWVWGYLQEYR